MEYPRISSRAMIPRAVRIMLKICVVTSACIGDRFLRDCCPLITVANFVGLLYLCALCLCGRESPLLIVPVDECSIHIDCFSQRGHLVNQRFKSTGATLDECHLVILVQLNLDCCVTTLWARIHIWDLLLRSSNDLLSSSSSQFLHLIYFPQVQRALQEGALLRTLAFI